MPNKTQKTTTLYKLFLQLYPHSFRKAYQHEMLQFFQDLQQESQQSPVIFWLKLAGDTFTSAFTEHLSLVQKQGIKKYGSEILHITPANIVGALLLAPFFLMLATDLGTRIIQSNISYPNTFVYARISRTIFFNPPAIFLWAILFPISAALLNIFSLIPTFKKYHGNILKINVLTTSIPTVIIISLGLGFFTLIIGHDFIPCIVNTILSKGFINFSHTFQICRNA